jgi:carbamoyltransferase
MITAGLGSVERHGCVALADDTHVIGVCDQERVTRIRNAGFNVTGLPDEALDLLLHRLGRSRDEVRRYVVAESSERPGERNGLERLDHHFAHACASYLSSAYTDAAIVVCDHEAPKVSVWTGKGATVVRVDHPWHGEGFGDVYSRCARVFGFRGEGRDQRFEALARLCPHSRDARVDRLFAADESSIWTAPGVELALERLIAKDPSADAPLGAAVASAVQARIGELLLYFLERVRVRTGCDRLCLAGSFFYHSSINTLARDSRLFASVFVPVDPGNAGLAVGSALQGSGADPTPLSPFLGPAYSAQETKDVLDNCKLQYAFESEGGAIETAVRALRQGTLVGWFDGAMEWGPRTLGARCILANPLAPYVLENLNRFLKHREPWRGYALSGPADAVRDYFEGPASAPFMECDFRPRDPVRFANVLPVTTAAIRVQTVDDGVPPAFRRLIEAFGVATGVPFVVNTSFNGFHEPVVCSPRDAVRVFYGSGLDLLIVNQFVLRK